jgi:hypothetical protein
MQTPCELLLEGKTRATVQNSVAVPQILNTEFQVYSKELNALHGDGSAVQRVKRWRQPTMEESPKQRYDP